MSDLSWWGVTVGSLAFATCSTNAAEAKSLSLLSIGVESNSDNAVPSFIHEHDSEDQQVLVERFGIRQQTVRMIPHSLDPWPEGRGAVCLQIN